MKPKREKGSRNIRYVLKTMAHGMIYLSLLVCRKFLRLLYMEHEFQNGSDGKIEVPQRCQSIFLNIGTPKIFWDSLYAVAAAFIILHVATMLNLRGACIITIMIPVIGKSMRNRVMTFMREIPLRLQQN